MSVLQAPPHEKPVLVPVIAPAEKKEAPAVRSFAHGLNFYKLFWIFFIGCFLGVVIENIWCLATQFKFESRQGLIYGPFNPVYGFGALMMTVGLHWLAEKRPIWIFLGSMVLGSVAEYICSWVQETVFGSLSWQYDDMPFNLNGRINLLYSVFWGVLGLLWIKFGYPRMSRLIEKIPNRHGVWLTWVLVVFMVFNMTISSLAAIRQSQRYAGIPASNALETFLDEHYDDELMSRVYANMVMVDPKAETPPAQTE